LCSCGAAATGGARPCPSPQPALDIAHGATNVLNVALERDRRRSPVDCHRARPSTSAACNGLTADDSPPLHERAAWHIGIGKLVIPADWSASSRRDVIVGSGAVNELGPFGVDAQTLAALTYDAHLVEIEQIERRTDAELLRIPRIGPRRRQEIREAIERYHQHRRATVT
jgi:hypothetical protein